MLRFGWLIQLFARSPNSLRSLDSLDSHMMQKLYRLVQGTASPDNPDSPAHHELLLGGHLYAAIIKEKLVDYLANVKLQIRQDLRRNPAQVNFRDGKYVGRVLSRVNLDIGKKLEYFLATGNVISNTGLDLQQVSGYTIVAEKLNHLRYLSHFRSVHRGAFFAELKTTTVRKLLPEAWGFLCPVHTPDGAPCGLLNHLSASCRVSGWADASGVERAVAECGVGRVPLLAKEEEEEEVEMQEVEREESESESMSEESSSASGKRKRDAVPTPSDDIPPLPVPADDPKLWNQTVTVQLDGRIIGWCSARAAKKTAEQLRIWKIRGERGIPADLEIALVPPTRGGAYPGLFLFSRPCRFVRPVRHLATGAEDLIGSLEQVYMDIACLPSDVLPNVSTHVEISPTNVLSVIANLTPFSDFNQSPRNMYQCQMGKQTMGTPAHALVKRTDNKMYRIQTGQTPIVRPRKHADYDMDSYPNGANAVVAVISYTGYDMEDAMIINKSAHERGFGYGSIYKFEWVDLADKKRQGEPVSHFFGLKSRGGKSMLNKEQEKKVKEFLDDDGLPRIGILLHDGDPLYAFVDEALGTCKVVRYKSLEDAYVDEVRLCGSDSGDSPLQKIGIKFRIPRPPVIGDKFSSRHGQKGVCSQKFPTVDMPFSESGIVPDVIINPHAFPSRMTIGMFVESLAGKSGAIYGVPQDATPFEYGEAVSEESAGDWFGKELAAAGYNYHGNEPMYSGITGQEFKADIYIGVVYYQRLRHMVSDKYQVRTTGPVHNLTMQPVKGRKRAGGIRFGEMERDSLLAHGVSFLLQDRLMNCSDYFQVS